MEIIIIYLVKVMLSIFNLYLLVRAFINNKIVFIN